MSNLERERNRDILQVTGSETVRVQYIDAAVIDLDAERQRRRIQDPEVVAQRLAAEEQARQDALNGIAASSAVMTEERLADVVDLGAYRRKQESELLEETARFEPGFDGPSAQDQFNALVAQGDYPKAVGE